MPLKIDEKNYKVYVAALVTIALIVIGAGLYFTFKYRERVYDEERARIAVEFTSKEINNTFVYYSKEKNRFIVVSDRELSTQEKIEIKEKIEEELEGQAKYAKEDGDLVVEFELEGSAVVKPRSIILEQPSTPYETLDPDVQLDPDSVVLD